jgi:hypothetical protein
MIQVFRREESPFVSARFRLRALTPDTRYAVTDLDTGTTQKFLGRELIEKGLLVAIADCPGSALVKYTKSDP